MISDNIFPQRLTKIDDLTRPDHSYLVPSDDCYFLGEYTARRGFAFSATNNLVLNLKKSMATRATAQWRHKNHAIAAAAAAFRAAINDAWLDIATLVPVPPSKAKTDPLYDDRLARMLTAIRPAPPLDVRELVVQRTSTTPVHDQEMRPGPADLEANYCLAPHLLNAPVRTIAVFDDVLTTGAHYRAVSAMIKRALPNIRIIGVFVARRLPEAIDVEDFDL